MKKCWFSLIGILLAASLTTQFETEKVVAESGSDVFGLQLRYYESAFECSGTQANIKVYIYDKNNNLLTTMFKGDTYTTADIDSVSDLRFKYQFTNYTSSHCHNGTDLYQAKKYEVLAPQDTIPTLSGYEDQQSISEMLADLNSYEELYLAELWTSDQNSSAYDLQDVVLIVDNNPSSLLFPD